MGYYSLIPSFSIGAAKLLLPYENSNLMINGNIYAASDFYNKNCLIWTLFAI